MPVRFDDPDLARRIGGRRRFVRFRRGEGLLGVPLPVLHGAVVGREIPRAIEDDEGFLDLILGHERAGEQQHRRDTGRIPLKHPRHLPRAALRFAPAEQCFGVEETGRQVVRVVLEALPQHLAGPLHLPEIPVRAGELEEEGGVRRGGEPSFEIGDAPRCGVTVEG